tara:strand:+ start:162 stop:524 length:363 start_codon:yes stop_codon:yes gene_type:complete
MSWQNILKNYKPLAHGVEGAKERNVGTSSVDYEMKDPTPRGKGFGSQGLGSKNLVLTNSDGSPRTVSQHLELARNNKVTPLKRWMGKFTIQQLKGLGKNPDTLTLQEYKQLEESGALSRR